MIVKEHAEGYHIYFHRAHALLASKIALKLKTKYWPLPNHWVDGLASIMEHDNGQPDWQGRSHLTTDGKPIDYRQQKELFKMPNIHPLLWLYWCHCIVINYTKIVKKSV